MKADLTFSGDFVRGAAAIRVVIENPARKFDGEFGLDLSSPTDTVDLVSRLRKLADDIENYVSEFRPKPTIEELEKILNAPDDGRRVTINPDGSISVEPKETKSA